MSSSRDRIGRMQPDNLPSGRPRRTPPEQDEPTTPPADPPAHNRELSVVSDPPESASKLASMLAGSDKPESGPSTVTGGDHNGPSVPLSVLTTPPAMDPDLDMVPSGIRWPRYLAEAIRTKAFLTRRSQQQVVLDALLGRDPLPPELVDECRRAAGRR